MLSWVVKVVPQPPEPPPKKVDEQKEEKPAAALPPAAAPPPVPEKKVTFEDECKPDAPKDDKPTQEAPAADSSPAPGAQPAVLTWISIALPQPAVSPKLSRANSTSKEESATTASKPEDEKGMIAWIAQGLEKVVPQPDLKGKESPPAEPPAEPPTEVCPAAPAPAAEPQVKVEVTSDQEDKKDQPVPPRIIDWIKHGLEKVVPQPEPHVRSKTDASEKTEAPPAKAEAPAPEPPPAPKPAADTEKSSQEAEQQANVVDWIISGIGRMLPQPVQKQDAGGDEVQSRGKGGESPLK